MSAQEAVQWADQLQAHKESLGNVVQGKEQATTAAFQGESRVSPSQAQTDTQSPFTQVKDKDQWADQSPHTENWRNTLWRTNDQAEAWSQAKHEQQHPDFESDAESVGSRDYPGAALARFEPKAQTFPNIRHQGRTAFKEKWMKDANSGNAGVAGTLLRVNRTTLDNHTTWGSERKEETVWDVLQVLRLMVSELRPEGWEDFGKYVGGRHPDALVEEARHWEEHTLTGKQMTKQKRGVKPSMNTNEPRTDSSRSPPRPASDQWVPEITQAAALENKRFEQNQKPKHFPTGEGHKTSRSQHESTSKEKTTKPRPPRRIPP